MTATTTAARPASTAAVEHFDVLIVGAGISGVGAAYHLGQQCPQKSFVVLEALESHGGTWLTHKYPGIRSDSDMHTLGFEFEPWREQKAIAEAIADPSLYAKDPQRATALHARYAEIDEELLAALERWEALAAR